MTDPESLDDFGDVLTPSELAPVLRCSVSTLKRRSRDGTLPIPSLYGISKGPRFAKIAVRRYLESGGRGDCPVRC